MKDLALIVEDDNDLVELFDKALVAAGFETEVIQDGYLANKRLEKIVPQVIFLDMHLPRMSGETLLIHIKSDTRLTKVCVVIITADALLGEDMYEIADFVMIKPVLFTQLRDFANHLHSWRKS